ncbi:type II toxin-antitoxin system PemK/MazF family toxin [Proteiniphilum sp. UBA5384]
MVDQLRAIDNKRLTKKIGKLPKDLSQKVIRNTQIVLGI